MKAQMSLEVMLYASLAGISLLSAIAYTMAMNGRGIELWNRYMAEVLVNNINAFTLEGHTGDLQVYVPSGMCNATFENSTGIISSAFGNYRIYGGTEIAKGVFCPDNEYAILYIAYRGGHMFVERDYNASTDKR